jgi:hypothetical protein
MRTIAILLAFVLLTGCKKSKPTHADSDPPKHVSTVGGPTGPNQNGNLSVSGSGSGFGAPQAVRKAGARIANKIELDQLRLSLAQSWLIDNHLPTPAEIMKEYQQNPQVSPLLKEEVVILTGATRGDQIWAYTQYPQQGGEHFVVTNQGVENMAPEVLRARLEQEKAPIKLSK